MQWELPPAGAVERKGPVRWGGHLVVVGGWRGGSRRHRAVQDPGAGWPRGLGRGLAEGLGAPHSTRRPARGRPPSLPHQPQGHYVDSIDPILFIRPRAPPPRPAHSSRWMQPPNPRSARPPPSSPRPPGAVRKGPGEDRRVRRGRDPTADPRMPSTPDPVESGGNNEERERRRRTKERTKERGEMAANPLMKG